VLRLLRLLRSPSLLIAFNGALLSLGVVLYARTRSQIVLAQTADSFLDVGSMLILLFCARVAARPRDEDHPFGHHRAEPIGALVTAILAGVLCVEVVQSAVLKWLGGETPSLDVPTLVWVASKLLYKLLLWWGLALEHGLRSPSWRALLVDARNDVAIASTSLLGAALARQGLGFLDSLLSIPAALYVGFSGVRLARDNLRYLMGESPPAQILEELRARVQSTVATSTLRSLRAQYLGASLFVEATILVDSGRSAVEAHDVSLDVAEALRSHPLVGEVFVHVDTGLGKDGT